MDEKLLEQMGKKEESIPAKKTVTKTVKYKKKDGTVVVKTYTYDKERYKPDKSTKRYYNRNAKYYRKKTTEKLPAYKVVTKTGRVHHKVEEAILNQYKDSSDYVKIKALIDVHKTQKKELSLTRIRYELNRIQILSILDSANMTDAELAEELNTTVDQLLNLNNWNRVTTKSGGTRVGNIFTNPDTGVQYNLDVTYDGTVDIKVDKVV